MSYPKYPIWQESPQTLIDINPLSLILIQLYVTVWYRIVSTIVRNSGSLFWSYLFLAPGDEIALSYMRNLFDHGRYYVTN